MEQGERSYLEELRATHQRRLHILERQQAQFGIQAPPHIVMEIEDIAAELKKLDDKLHRARAVHVDLLSYMDIAPLDSATIRLDWTGHFAGGIAAAEVWAQQLLPDLDRVYRQVGRAGPEPAVALRQRATISAGLAAGATFSAASGIRLWVEQRTDDQETQWWAAQEGSPSIVGLLLDERRAPGEAQSDDTLVEVGVAQDIGRSVGLWAQGQAFAEHIRLLPDLGPGRSVVPDAAHALAMARQIGAACVAAHAARPGGTIHLIVAAPFGLALMIGRRLNACGKVQCYDFDKGGGSYAPSCLLGATAASA